VIQATYDSSGNMTSLTPPGEAPSTLGFNLTALLTQYIPPVVTGSSASSTPYQWTYDLDHRLTQFTWPDGTAQYNLYDPTTGNLVQTGGSATPGSGIQYAYSSSTGYRTQEIVPFGSGTYGAPPETLSFTYQGSLLSGVNYAGFIPGQINYAYNNNFQVSELQIIFGNLGAPSAGSVNEAFSYDRDGLVQFGMRYYNATTERWTSRDPLLFGIQGLKTVLADFPATATGMVLLLAYAGVFSRKLSSLNLWPGDRHFIALVAAEKPFQGTVWYRGQDVVRYQISVL
jgi:YD repeat-containing protein